MIKNANRAGVLVNHMKPPTALVPQHANYLNLRTRFRWNCSQTRAHANVFITAFELNGNPGQKRRAIDDFLESLKCQNILYFFEGTHISVSLLWKYFVPHEVVVATFTELNRRLMRAYPSYLGIDIAQTTYTLDMHGPPPTPSNDRSIWILLPRNPIDRQNTSVQLFDKTPLPRFPRLGTSWLVGRDLNGFVSVTNVAPAEFQEVCERIENELFPLSHSKI